MLARTGRDIVLVDEARHPMWIAAAKALAERMGSTTYIVLQVHQPTTRWFEDNRLAVPQPKQLDAFARDGIVLLPARHQDRMLSYNTESFACIAVTACLDEAASRYAGREVRLELLGGSNTALAEQRMLARRVLEAFDALNAEDLASSCEVAFLSDPKVASMHLNFEDLRTRHRAIWLEQLNNVWLQKRASIAKLAAVDHK